MGSYDLYLRAMPLLRIYAKPQVLQALDLASRAITIDPDYASALYLAATCHYIIVTYRWTDDPERNRREGIELAHRALKVGHDDALVLSSAAFVLAYLERDLDAARVLIDKAITLNPGSALPRLFSGVVRMRAGDPDGAVEHLEAALRLDPVGLDHPAYLSMLGMARLYQGRFADAVALEKEVTQLNDAALPYAVLAASEGQLGHADAARAALAQYRSLTDVPIEDYARGYSREPAQLKLFLDGIALAEGKNPADATEAAHS